jgi:hypothetical protein
LRTQSGADTSSCGREGEMSGSAAGSGLAVMRIRWTRAMRRLCQRADGVHAVGLVQGVISAATLAAFVPPVHGGPATGVSVVPGWPCCLPECAAQG